MGTKFNALRLGAREKRDRLLAEVREEYEPTQIARLDQDLRGTRNHRYKKISAAIEAVIPSDRPFTTPGFMAGLEALDPGRVWRMHSVVSHVTLLREKGLIKRIKRATFREPAQYARAELPAKAVPLDDTTLADGSGACWSGP